MEKQWSPKPPSEGSTPSVPAKDDYILPSLENNFIPQHSQRCKDERGDQVCICGATRAALDQMTREAEEMGLYDE